MSARPQNADCRSPKDRTYDFSPAAAITGLSPRHVYPPRWQRGEGCRAGGFCATYSKMPPGKSNRYVGGAQHLGPGGKRAVMVADTRQQV